MKKLIISILVIVFNFSLYGFKDSEKKEFEHIFRLSYNHGIAFGQSSNSSSPNVTYIGPVSSSKEYWLDDSGWGINAQYSYLFMNLTFGQTRLGIGAGLTADTSYIFSPDSNIAEVVGAIEVYVMWFSIQIGFGMASFTNNINDKYGFSDDLSGSVIMVGALFDYPLTENIGGFIQIKSHYYYSEAWNRYSLDFGLSYKL